MRILGMFKSAVSLINLEVFLELLVLMPFFSIDTIYI